MLSDVGVNFRVGRLHFFSQLLLCISLRQDARLLQSYLQLDGALLVDTGGHSFTFANEHLTKLSLNLLHLLFRNLAAGKLWVFCLRIADEKIKPCLVPRLLEKLFNFLIGNVWTSLAGALRLEIV